MTESGVAARPARRTNAGAKAQSANATKTGGNSARKERILRAAAARFAEFGFEATTVRQIADDVKILSGSLYHHFATKEQMLEEIVHDAIMTRRDDTLRVAALDLDPERRLITLISDELAALTRDLEAFSIIFNERKFFRRSPYFSEFMKARKEAYDAWQAILEDGIKAGQFREDIDVYLTISTIVRMLNSGADWYAHEDGSPVDALVNYSLEDLTEFYIGFILRSIRTPERAALPIAIPEIES